MKAKKLISKGLVLGIMLNNLFTISYANVEIPNRYQTLEGEYITIDNPTESSIEEIEIFGDTVQDPNILENIQSVGDLYVDDDGSPILDNQGREQYKTEIVSIGKNLFNAEKASINNGWRSTTKLINQSEFEVTPNEGLNEGVAYGEVRVPFKLIKGETYTISSIKTGGASYILCWDANTYATEAYPVNEPFVADDILDIKIGLYVKLNESGTFKIQIEKGEKTSFSSYKSNKIQLILPAQLQKVGSIADRLYWDESDKKYFIEKNIKEDILNGTETNWTKSFDWVNLDGQNTISFQRPMKGIVYKAQREIRILSNKFKSMEVSSASTIINDEEWIRPYSSTSENVGIRILKSKLSGENVDDFKNWLKYNPLKIYYQLNFPEIIKTDINTKLTLPTYDGKTHIYVNSENALNPTLKVTVDRLPQIAKEAVTQANTDSNIYNISLARMYVNMLPESLYKDQLQEQLNNILNLNEMTLERKKVTANVDLYIKCENILQMSLSTNSITFDDFSGVEDMTKENAVQISINSSLPYSLNAYLPTEIQNSDKSNTMDKQILNIKENSELEYKTFSNTVDKIILKDNNPAGNNLSHGINIKLKGNIAHQKDVYKTTIKFEAQQK